MYPSSDQSPVQPVNPSVSASPSAVEFMPGANASIAETAAQRPFTFRDGEGLPPGYRDQFFERRFPNKGEINFDYLIDSGKIAYLTKAVHVDEIYVLRGKHGELPAGQYRIRDAGSDRPFVTLKKQGDSLAHASETIDMVDPSDATLATIRQQGELLAVIEKYRQTYQSKLRPQCLLHSDFIPGLGQFYDVKADKLEHLSNFLADLGLSQASPIAKSYLMMKQEKGISPVQLRIWQFHQKFEDYIQGVVSGTLTPLGFLTTAIASGGAKPTMIVALLTAGILDGLSDSVAAAQTTQSASNSKWLDQATMFTKTMAGKIAMPCTFIPIVVAVPQPLHIAIVSSLWAAGLLAATATVQSVANEKRALPDVARLLLFSGASVTLGTVLGKVVLPALEKLF